MLEFIRFNWSDKFEHFYKIAMFHFNLSKMSYGWVIWMNVWVWKRES